MDLWQEISIAPNDTRNGFGECECGNAIAPTDPEMCHEEGMCSLCLSREYRGTLYGF